MVGKLTHTRSSELTGSRTYNFAICCAIVMFALAAPTLQAQTSYHVIHHFLSSVDGAQPNGLSRDSAGNLYGTATNGGSAGFGTVFKLSAATHAFTVLHSFTSDPDGATPEAAVTVDAAGNLYGTTVAGGTGGGFHAGVGTIFKIDSAGVETVVHNFTTFTDGNQPAAKLVRDSAGNLYGTTLGGGHGFAGTVFRFSALGTEVILHQFNSSDGDNPRGIVRGSAGDLYGTTLVGGASSEGTVYELGADGTQTVLHSFTGGADGGHPWDEPVIDGAGNLYGTASAGGDFGRGVVFKIDASGNFSVLHSFNGTDGEDPVAGLVLDAAGNLYGTTLIGGNSNFGVVFKLDPSGNETVLHSFASGADGAHPAATLLLNSDGSLFGSTQSGGAHSDGTLFRLKP